MIVVAIVVAIFIDNDRDNDRDDDEDEELSWIRQANSLMPSLLWMLVRACGSCTLPLLAPLTCPAAQVWLAAALRRADQVEHGGRSVPLFTGQRPKKAQALLHEA